MSSYQKEREQFIAQFTRETPEGVYLKNGIYFRALDAARLVLRHAKTHGRLAVEECNGHPLQSQCPPKGCDMQAYNSRVNKLQDQWDARIEKKQAQIEARITTILAPFNISADFGGDPRGYTVKLHLPSETNNTWGRDGYGVPQ